MFQSTHKCFVSFQHIGLTMLPKPCGMMCLITGALSPWGPLGGWPKHFKLRSYAYAARPLAARLTNHSWPFAARLIHYSSLSPALRSSCYPPQLAHLGHSQLISFTTARPARPFAARLIHHRAQLTHLGSSQLVSFTTARPARPFEARPFEARLIHHSSPNPALRSSSHSPQLAQIGSSQLVSFTTARPTRLFAAHLINHSWPFAARLINHSSPSPVLRNSFLNHSSPSPALRSSSRSLQLAQLGSSQLVSFTTARPVRHFAARSQLVSLFNFTVARLSTKDILVLIRTGRILAIPDMRTAD